MGTKDLEMTIIPDPHYEYDVRISADASFAPGGDRSRTGVVLPVRGSIVHWLSQKQSLTAMSAHEAELEGTVTGVKQGLVIAKILEELEERPTTLKLDQDNQATIRTITTQMTSWRTRHYAVRAAWIRDIIKVDGITMEHIKGVEIIADPLTKVLGGEKLHESWKKLQLQYAAGAQYQ